MPRPQLTRDEFLARCGTAYDAGLCTPERLSLLEAWLDMVMRLEGGQIAYFFDRLESEKERTDGFRSSKTLASDADGYALIQFTAILDHPCQECATNPGAWWTRVAFCPHDRNEAPPRLEERDEPKAP